MFPRPKRNRVTTDMKCPDCGSGVYYYEKIEYRYPVRKNGEANMLLREETVEDPEEDAIFECSNYHCRRNFEYEIDGDQPRIIEET